MIASAVLKPSNDYQPIQHSHQTYPNAAAADDAVLSFHAVISSPTMAMAVLLFEHFHFQYPGKPRIVY